MGNLGFQEILLIAVVILVLFGSRKIPEFMRGLGKGIREFNDAKDNVKKELEAGMQEKDQQVKPSVNTTTPVSATPPVTAAQTNNLTPETNTEVKQ
jgi:sec-independent protein translocase protein TatA